ncbi:MAG: hypothetical protein CBC38_01330 [Gammaproteobacteria bacterium TMED78]|nr:MAG: hypothetical protein CBC38_01330 [Gammaproteobacteria bacterium TMED78]|tara:strand:+ start:27720 stop:28580 length:861 start_codon:yes stop_codon:yes gene_type:complete
MFIKNLNSLSIAIIALLFLNSSFGQPPQRINPRNDLSLMAREPFQVFDNLFFVGQGEVASYVIETSDGLILIDTMWDNDGYTEYLLDNIIKVGLEPKNIKYVLILQGHRDHYGGAPALQKILNAQFGAAEEDWLMIERDFGEYAPRRDFVIKEGDELILGNTKLAFEITPGHTPGTISIIFSVFDNGTEYKAYFHGGPALRTEDLDAMKEFLADLERIKLIPDIEVQVVNHYDIHASTSDDLFARAERLKNRKDSEAHPWVAPDEFQLWLDELILDTKNRIENASN